MSWPPSSYREAEDRAQRLRSEPGLVSIDFIDVARTQPGAMVNDRGDVFYPDNAEDAEYFATELGARLLHEAEPDAKE